MAKILDKYKAIWLSHSSISDFLRCPRAYYYKAIFKNPKTGRKITIAKPPLSLGQAIHKVIDELSTIDTNSRFDTPLVDRFESVWKTLSGVRGGFFSEEEEKAYKDRGYKIIEMLSQHPGPLARKTVKIKEETPYYWFSENDEIILCGKIDWLEYHQDTDSVSIVEFKTGKHDEQDGSLQLPIYVLLAQHSQKRPVSGVLYWYVDKSTMPKSLPMPDIDAAQKKIAEIGSRIKLARQLSHFKCAKDEKNGCIHCAPLAAVVSGKGTFVGLGDFKEEVYVLKNEAVSL